MTKYVRRRQPTAEQARRQDIARKLAAWQPTTLTAVRAGHPNNPPLFNAVVQAGIDPKAGEIRG